LKIDHDQFSIDVIYKCLDDEFFDDEEDDDRCSETMETSLVKVVNN
jgi:hypothetical protein